MTPTLLTLEAFGPFPGLVRVDFRALAEGGTFLVCGETGAGKTAIFDALTFALFGTASGGDRNGGELRSDLADPATLTRVELDFDLGGRSYRVFRQPRQLRPRVHGGGLTDAPAEAELWDRTGVTGQGVALAVGATKVTDAVSALLHLSATQYRQTGILPQGEFRQVVTGGPKEREEVLRRLFDTQPHRALQDRLKAETNQLGSELHDLQTQVDTLCQTAGVSSPDEVKALLHAAGEQFGAARADREVRAAEARAADQALDQARVAQGALDELEGAGRAVDALEAERPENEVRKGALDGHQRAEQLVDLHDQTVSLQKDLATARSDVAAATEACEMARRTLALRDGELATERSKDSAREQADRRVAHLKELTLIGVEPARLERVAAEEALERAVQREAKQAEEAARARDVATQAGSKVLELARLAEDAPDSTRWRTLAEEALEGRRKRDRLLVAAAGLEAELADVRREFEQAEALVGTATDALDSLIDARLAAQAATLAESLTEGESCPVCGSLDHPSPATHGVDGPTSSALQTARDQLAEAQKALDEARDRRDQVRQRQDRAAGELSSLPSDETPMQDLLEAVQTTTERERICLNAAASLATAQDAATKSEKLAKAAEALLATLQDQRRDLDIAAAGKVAVHDERLASIPEVLRGDGALALALEQAQERAARLHKALEDARDAAEKAAIEAEGAQARQAEREQTLGRAKNAADQALKTFAHRRAEAGFANDRDWEAARLPDNEAARLRQAIELWSTSRSEAQGRLGKAQTAAKGLVAPDLPALQEAFELAGQFLAEANTRLGECSERHKTLSDNAGKLRDAETLRLALDARYSIVSRLNDVARGAEGLKLTFERYVLAAFLDEVLQAANIRLHAMTAGQFTLIRTDAGRRGGGLDLSVDDAYTGTRRRAQTLSGGEGFQAALSLALGLSDTVQARSGGVHLDSLFIDEGFGSLGDEALDRVMGTLEDMGAGRMIGLISHVRELRDRIPSQLEVRKSPEGSTLHVSA